MLGRHGCPQNLKVLTALRLHGVYRGSLREIHVEMEETGRLTWSFIRAFTIFMFYASGPQNLTCTRYEECHPDYDSDSNNAVDCKANVYYLRERQLAHLEPNFNLAIPSLHMYWLRNLFCHIRYGKEHLAGLRFGHTHWNVEHMTVVGQIVQYF